MKTSIQTHLGQKGKKSRRRLTSRQRGVAILIVLAVIVLMSVLVLSFFQMSKSEQVQSKVNADMLRSYTLRDTAINLAIGQIRQATAPALTGSGGNALWTSQPGMIRTFNQNGSNSDQFKLYSARQMRVGGTVTDSAITADDLPAAWETKPESFVDLNKPVFRSNVNNTAAATNPDAATNSKKLYPIIDPASYDSHRSVNENPEGLVYGQSNVLASSPGLLSGSVANVNGIVDGQSLPMPVRWLYVRQNGTIGYLNDANKFTTTASAGGGVVQTEDNTNPIVGRIAFWADDESCKINVNTASEGVFWDQPRCDTQEERFYAECQPGKDEYQRFPGHPAMVSLSSVLFPNHRYYPVNRDTNTGNARKVPFTIDKKQGGMDALTPQQIGMIWDLAPWISDRNSGATQGAGSIAKMKTDGIISPFNLASLSATVDSRLSNNLDDHPYTSMDEMLFRASVISKTGADGTSQPQRALWTDTSGGTAAGLTESTFMQRLNRAQFLLTTKSNAPETNMFGHPRICLWPVNQEVPTIAATVNTPGGTYKDNASFYDSIIGLTCQLSPKNYYYVLRNDIGSRHDELRKRPDSDPNRHQNARIRKYLERATGNEVPNRRFPGIDVNVTQSMLNKYVGRVTGSGGRYSDRGAVVLNMLDYIRMSNLADPTLKAANRYGVAGQVTAYCGCKQSSLDSDGYIASIHNSTWALMDNPDPKGMGRMYTPSEIAFVIVKVGEVVNGTLQGPATGDSLGVDYKALVTNKDDATKLVDGVSIYEMAAVVEGFCPTMGWNGIYPRISANLSCSELNNSAESLPTQAIPSLMMNGDAVAPTLKPSSRVLAIQTENQVIGDVKQIAAQSTAAADPVGMYPLGAKRWGGAAGIRPFSGPSPSSNALSGFKTCILFKPFVVPNSVTSLKFTADTVSTSPKPNPETYKYDKYYWRLTTFDAADLGIGSTVQSMFFNFGKDYDAFTWPKPNGLNRMPLAKRLGNAFTTGLGGGNFGDAVIRSLYLPHGDYRLLTMNRVVGPNSVGGVAKDRKHWMSLVPHPDFYNTGVQNASYLFEPEAGYFSSKKPDNTLAILPTGKLPAIIERTDYPVPHTDTAGDKTDPFGSKGWYDVIKDPATDARGCCDPGVTGDWDNGIAGAPDGAYTNRPDDGDLRPWFGSASKSRNKLAYFEALEEPTPTFPDPTGNADISGKASFSPNRLIRSAVQFGSIPTGAELGVPWQTLLFRPDPYRNLSKEKSNAAPTATDSRHYGSALAQFPKDHLFLDFFWMPVVQPYALSDTFSTKGKINMNYNIVPFSYIKRNTGLHALLKAERMLAIPTAAGKIYKTNDPGDTSSGPENKALWREYIDPKWTLSQFDRKFASLGEFAGDNSRVFRTASEICDLWLVPESLAPQKLDSAENLRKAMQEYWVGTTTLGQTPTPSNSAGHRLTGDNSKEAPYSNIYPRLTTKSNVFKVHITVQTIQKARSSDPETFDPAVDLVTSEYRGSAIVERALDMTNPTLKNTDYLNPDDTAIFTDTKKRLDYFYSFRITEIKQFAP